MPASAEPRLCYEDIAGMIEHPVLRPEFSEEEVHTGCEIARQYRIAAVTVRPSDVDLAVNWMRGSGVPLSLSSCRCSWGCPKHGQEDRSRQGRGMPMGHCHRSCT